MQDYGFRLYNPSIGKFLSVDPLAQEYPWYTPYQFAGNMPIWAIDIDGLEPGVATEHNDGAGPKNKEKADWDNSQATGGVTEDGRVGTATAKRIPTAQPTMRAWSKSDQRTSDVLQKSQEPGMLGSFLTFIGAQATFSGEMTQYMEKDIILKDTRVVATKQLSTITTYEEELYSIGKNKKPYPIDRVKSNQHTGSLKNAPKLSVVTKTEITTTTITGEVHIPKTDGLLAATRVFKGINLGVGLYGYEELTRKRLNGTLETSYGKEMASNTFSTFGGKYGAAWGIGVELGRHYTIPNRYYQSIKWNYKWKMYGIRTPIGIQRQYNLHGNGIIKL